MRVLDLELLHRADTKDERKKPVQEGQQLSVHLLLSKGDWDFTKQPAAEKGLTNERG
jgi:hypothetical protein